MYSRLLYFTLQAILGLGSLCSTAHGAPDPSNSLGRGLRVASIRDKTVSVSSKPADGGGGQAAAAACLMQQGPCRRAKLAEAASAAANAAARLAPGGPSSPSPLPSPARPAQKRRRPPPAPVSLSPSPPRPKSRRGKPPSPAPPPPPPPAGRRGKPPSPAPPPPPPPAGRRGKPPSPVPPSPPPPSPPRPGVSGSLVCGALSLNATAITKPANANNSPFDTFGSPTSCAALSDTMIRNLTDAARAVGALLTAPFALQRCSATYDPAAAAKPLQPPHVLVCGTFASDSEAAKMGQGQAAAAATLRRMLVDWQYLLLGRSSTIGLQEVCPPPGTVVTSWVWSEVPDLVVAFHQTRCSSN